MSGVNSSLAVADSVQYNSAANAQKTTNKNVSTTVSLDVVSNSGVEEHVVQQPIPKTNLGEIDKAKYEDILNDEVKLDFITESLNELMTQWNADLKFAIHKETGKIMVKFVNSKNDRVIKEFPPEQYLDMIANIRKYIGNVVDEKI